MTHIKRSLLIALTVAFLFSGCSSAAPETQDAPESIPKGSSPTPSETEPAVETEEELKDNVPEGLDFSGAAFNVLAGEEYGCVSFVDEQNGEIMNDTRFNMRIAAEDRLNVRIGEETTPYWTMTNTVVQLTASGDTVYDTISMSDRFSVNCALQGTFLPMAEIPYVELEQIYWGDGLSDMLSIGGKYYFAVSSFNLYSLDRTVCLCFNEAVAADYGIAIPFEDVFNGTWTFDQFEAYGDIAVRDVNGDGTMDREDSYTYGAGDIRDVTEKILYASDVPLIAKDSDGVLCLPIFGNEKFVDITERVRALFYTDKCAAKADSISTVDLFLTNRELVSVVEFYNLIALREMESDFSILPLPKFDETQPKYASRTCNAIFSMTPVTAQELDKIGAVEECLCCWGYKNLIPAYIESSMQNRTARNQDSADAIRIIYDSRVIDLGKAYLSDYFNVQWYETLFAGNSVVTKLESQKKMINKSM